MFTMDAVIFIKFFQDVLNDMLDRIHIKSCESFVEANTLFCCLNGTEDEAKIDIVIDSLLLFFIVDLALCMKYLLLTCFQCSYVAIPMPCTSSVCLMALWNASDSQHTPAVAPWIVIHLALLVSSFACWL